MKRRILAVVALATAFSCVAAVAANLYKWVDKDGKVHYSQTRSATAPASEAKIELRTPSGPNNTNNSTPQAERDASGNCLTVKCLADQMESERLAREHEYARQIAENERAGKKNKNIKESKSPAAATGLDEHLRENCRRGLYYGASSRVNCDDIAALRDAWRSHQMGIERGRGVLERRPELMEPGYRH